MNTDVLCAGNHEKDGQAAMIVAFMKEMGLEATPEDCQIASEGLDRVLAGEGRQY